MTEPDKNIDLEPNKHSSSYELKPESKWLLLGAIPPVLLFSYLNGFTTLWTWSLLGTGILVGLGLVVVFPHILLKKMDD